jgi:hypothetical protein
MLICKMFTIFLLISPNLESEIPIIKKSAERNGIQYKSDDWYLLLAIRMAENGRPGREFGILNSKAYNLDLQAARCAYTIRNQHIRSGIKEVNEKYLLSLQKRYCPENASNDPQGLNKNWLKNVTYHFNKLKRKRTSNSWNATFIS